MTTKEIALEEMLCFSLYTAAHAMNRVYKPLLEKLGLTYPQYLVMRALWASEGQTVKALGQTLFLDSGTLTPLLKRLEAAGLVRRMRNPADERELRLELTEAGRALQDSARPVPARVAQAAGCGSTELARLTREIRDLRARLDTFADTAETAAAS
ncbi:MarR family winged helix-turn-helix transcriptional regulator [Arboricoccus pini]|uniref:MarR family winged helix-turn-helix transcriptional regulator n=1 Tax=Arboricoccus pini TaxID=1963835 RepID=UPI002AC837E7|nr:MarR family transcriptional regulator [Arboricoccus pini]